jgi:hypothetical protein
MGAVPYGYVGTAFFRIRDERWGLALVAAWRWPFGIRDKG